jgi:F-type H+-transporting ATPase subunit a
MQHIETQILGQTVHADTLYFTWACMGFILLAGVFLVSGLSADVDKFGKRQFFAEGIFSFIRGLTRDQIGKRGDQYVFFIGSIFLFILVNYYAGLLPWKMGSLFEWWPQMPVHEVASAAAEHGNEVAGAAAHEAVEHASHPWHGASPCADINVPAGMALVVVCVYFLSGALVGGFKYIQEFLPVKFSKKGISFNGMFLIELMDLAVRPLTLSLRLLANTVAGEILLATFITFTLLVPAIIPLPGVVLAFEVAVGLLQAFIFTILSTVYIGVAVKHAEHLVHDDHH